MIWSHDLRMELPKNGVSGANNSYENWLQQFVNFIINPNGKVFLALHISLQHGRGSHFQRANDRPTVSCDIKFHGVPGTQKLKIYGQSWWCA